MYCVIRRSTMHRAPTDGLETAIFTWQNPLRIGKDLSENSVISFIKNSPYAGDASSPFSKGGLRGIFQESGITLRNPGKSPLAPLYESYSMHTKFYC